MLIKNLLTAIAVIITSLSMNANAWWAGSWENDNNKYKELYNKSSRQINQDKFTESKGWGDSSMSTDMDTTIEFNIKTQSRGHINNRASAYNNTFGNYNNEHHNDSNGNNHWTDDNGYYTGNNPLTYSYPEQQVNPQSIPQKKHILPQYKTQQNDLNSLNKQYFEEAEALRKAHEERIRQWQNR